MDTVEQTRVDALEDLGLLDTPSEERFDRVVRLAKRLFDVPTVAVNLLDQDRLFIKSAVGFESGVSVPRDAAFCPTAIESGATMVIPDARASADWADNPSVTGAPHVRFYAGAPLAAPGGEYVGALCLMDQQTRDLSDNDRALLEDLAAWVEYELAADADAVQAKEIQRRLLPRSSPQLPGYEVAGACQPALHVGGDYYDWHLLDDTLLQVTLADVMGKGISAAIIAAGLRTALRVASRSHTLTESVRRVAAGLQDDFTDSGTFATVFTARLRPQHGHLEYVDAGHGLGIVVSDDGESRRLSSSDLPLGVDPDVTWSSHEARLDPGDTLIVVSDGLLDVFEDPADAVRAGRELATSAVGAQEMVDRILAVGAGKPLSDDLTALVIRRNGDSVSEG